MLEDEIDDKDKHPMHKFIDNPKVQLLLLIVTMYSLFSDDYRILVSAKHLDVIYDVFTIICLVIFSIEIFIAAIWKISYFNSYYFYLDILSTASLILDFSPVNNALILFSYTGNSGISKIGNLLGLIRLFRLVRISKIYKSLSATDDSNDSKDDSYIRQKKHKTDSRVGRRLSESATRVVIVICFMLLILLPLFSSDFWLSTDSGPEGAAYTYKALVQYNFANNADLQNIKYLPEDNLNVPTNQANMLAYTTKRFLDDFNGESKGQLLKVILPNSNVDYYVASNFSDYRLEEIDVGVLKIGDFSLQVHQDISKTNVMDAILNIIRTFYICALLLGGSSLFNLSTYKLIIEPIENMTEKVRQVSEKPQKIKEQAFIAAEEKEVKDHFDLDNLDDEEEEDVAKKMSMETHIISDAISKIGILLGVGLGEAGSSLIGTYLRNTKDSDNDVLMKNVQEINAIFGFCDIRNYTDATEVLQQEVMVFVNRIADIVHTICDRNLGAANKNVGDAFMVVWKIPGSLSAEVKFKLETGSDNPPPDYYVEEHNRKIFTNLADMSMYAVMKMIAEINRTYELKYYADHEGLQKRLNNPNYKPKLGFGIHYGWAIEGAIGSYHKVDVSYLSPHVNVSGFLESETKGYGADLLISSDFFDLLTPDVKKYCRKVDILKTADGIMSIYTPNMSDKAFAFPAKAPLKQHVLKTKECYTFKKLLKSEILSGNNVGPAVFENDIDIRLLTCQNNPDFIEAFNEGFAAIETSEWTKSRENFDRALLFKPGDIQTEKLLHYVTKDHPDRFPGYIGIMGGGH
jgi:class 3 adenylate cyclase